MAGSAAWAEVFTKVAFVLAPDEAIACYARHGLAALLSIDDGTAVATRTWKEFER